MLVHSDGCGPTLHCMHSENAELPMKNAQSQGPCSATSCFIATEALKVVREPEPLIASYGRTAGNRGKQTHVTKEPGLAALGVQMAVAAEEGVEGGQLVPPRLQLRIHIPEEAAHVRPCRASHTLECCRDCSHDSNPRPPAGRVTRQACQPWESGIPWQCAEPRWWSTASTGHF